MRPTRRAHAAPHDDDAVHGCSLHARLVLSLVLLLSCALKLSACSGCGSNGEGGEPNASCPEVPCRSTQRCVEGVCLGLADVVCLPRCGEGEICQLGECVEGVEVCEQVGQRCDVARPISGALYCIDWDGVTTGDAAICSARCSSELTCDPGEGCFVLSGLDDSACEDDSTCRQGTRCIEGACQAAACQPSECEGFLSGLGTCERKYASGTPEFPFGATCQELPDGTSFCFEAGAGALGERCEPFLDAFFDDALEGTCNRGLACVQGLCQTACSEDAACLAASGPDQVVEDTCLFAEEDFIAQGVGFCGRACAPFSTGECGEQGKCLPLDGERGRCVPAGEVEAFEACEPGQGQCSEGSSCVAFGGGEQGRCLPLCDVTVAPADPSAPVGEGDQALRDETCPQAADEALAYLRITHLNEALGAVDIYLDRELEEAFVLGLEPGEFEAREGGFLSVAPGTRLLEIYAQGTPPTQAPLAEATVSLRRDEVREVALGASAPQSADALRLSSREEPTLQGDPSRERLLWHLVPDLSAPLVAVRYDVAGEELGRSAPIAYRASSAVTMPPRGGELALVIEAEGSMVGPVVIWRGQVDEESERLLYLTGTRFEDDALRVELLGLKLNERPAIVPPPPRMRCEDLGNAAFGACQQACRGARDYGETGFCQGEGMGCYPVRLPGFGGFKSLCQPQGAAQLGDRCDPFVELSACASGLYCQEYGNGDPGVMAGLERGVCERLCGIEAETSGGLLCAAGQTCQPIDEVALDVGRCGQSCEPDGEYSDAMCPPGLSSCKPMARLSEDVTGSGDSAPVVVRVEPACSASGTIAEGEGCPGVDCQPGTECLYERSAQQDLVSTLLSAYFSAPGERPICRAMCDPFDELSASRRCGVGETCLVNFPWSADVGHCAPIVEQAQPFQPCARPGEACGEDSVCVIDGGEPFCLRLCEYVGGRSSMMFERSTCPAGLQCGPLVNDVGICL